MTCTRKALLALVAAGALCNWLTGTSHAAILVPGQPTSYDVQAQMAHANFPGLTGRDSSLVVHFALCTETAPCP
jgi:hypothetical protein